MSNRHWLIAGIVTALLLLLIPALLWGVFIAGKTTFSTYTYRYRLSVQLEVDGVTKVGSSVIEVQNRAGWHWPESARFSTKVLGDAIFIDLGSKGHVIAILGFGASGREDYLGGLALEKFGLRWNEEDLKRIQTLQGKRDLRGQEIPTLVTFADINDPKSVQIIQPQDLPKKFGEEVRFLGASIELTHDPVTRWIGSKLPWLPHSQYLSGQFGCSPDEAHCLHGGNFTR